MGEQNCVTLSSTRCEPITKGGLVSSRSRESAFFDLLLSSCKACVRASVISMGSSKKVNGVGSSPPFKFKAGGKSPTNQSHSNEEEHDVTSIEPRSAPIQPFSPSPAKPITSSVLQAGLSKKRSPLQMKNWIACVLTLDGRDKFTKILQYMSRLLCWWFSGLAKRQSISSTGVGASSGVGSNSVVMVGSGASSILSALLFSQNIELRNQYYTAISKRFEVLYKSLVTSRKAFRLGRSVIELDKISSMGWGDYLRYMMLHPLAGGAADADVATADVDGEKAEEMGETIKTANLHSTLARYDTHPIPEEEDSRNEDDHGEDDDNDEASWDARSKSDEDCDDDDGLPMEEKKIDSPLSSTKVKAISRPGRPKLPTRISSNVGWGPATTASSSQGAATRIASPEQQSPSRNKTVPRTVSEMGRQMYRPFPSRSSSMGSYKQVKDTLLDGKEIIPPSMPPPPATPSWKLIGGTMKLLGLMGFWAFDNLAFLTGSGFLDPIHGANNNKNEVLVTPKAADRLKRKKSASEWAARCYFIGSVGGLYVNVRSLWIHWSGQLHDAHDQLSKAIESSGNTNGDGSNSNNDEAINQAKEHLQKTQQKHFELCLALLKSCCDFMVFSNNPGIDLHLKYRGRKNHEGLHCLGGLVSAGTVLYNNFPNA